jgi:serine/threonine-protein kinase RsbW
MSDSSPPDEAPCTRDDPGAAPPPQTASESLREGCWEWTIPSRPEALKAVLEEILLQLARRRWNERELFGVRLSLEEAVVNAIRHGNGYDPNKSVDIVCRIEANLLHLEVQDEGPGFRPEDVPDPTEPENLENISGRGIMLMRSFMTRVEYNEIGNRVIMEKERSASEA